MTWSQRDAEHRAMVRHAAIYCGRNLAHALRGSKDMSFAEAISVKGQGDSCLLRADWATVCEKAGWTKDDRDFGYLIALNAYYDRVTGKD